MARKHKFVKAKKAEAKKEEASSAAASEDMPPGQAPGAPMGQVPMASEGGSVKAVAATSRMSKMYSPKRVVKGA